MSDYGDWLRYVTPSGSGSAQVLPMTEAQVAEAAKREKTKTIGFQVTKPKPKRARKAK